MEVKRKGEEEEKKIVPIKSDYIVIGPIDKKYDKKDDKSSTGWVRQPLYNPLTAGVIPVFWANRGSWANRGAGLTKVLGVVVLRTRHPR